MADRSELHYIIGVGSPEDWEAGHGSLYYIEDKKGEKALPVFTTQEGLLKFVEANFGTPEAYMQMLEGLGANAETHGAPLADESYTFMPVNWEGLTMAAFNMDADYLIRDPRPGGEQEILRVSK